MHIFYRKYIFNPGPFPIAMLVYRSVSFCGAFLCGDVTALPGNKTAFRLPLEKNGSSEEMILSPKSA